MTSLFDDEEAESLLLEFFGFFVISCFNVFNSFFIVLFSSFKLLISLTLLVIILLLLL